MLKLMYITNRADVAEIADENGIDRVMIDLEKKGKAQRQHGWSAVMSNHEIGDIPRVKAALRRAELLVRINPMDDDSEQEIEEVLQYEPDYIMLPYFKTAAEVRRFAELVSGRAKLCPLIETKEAVDALEEILEIRDIHEVHIGLNDLSHSYGHTFLFETMSNGAVENIVKRLREKGVTEYGIGGIAKIGYGLIPAEDVICEHYRLGSQCAILSRAFCNVDEISDADEIRRIFAEEVPKIRRMEGFVAQFDQEMFDYGRKRFAEKVGRIVAKQCAQP